MNIPAATPLKEPLSVGDDTVLPFQVEALDVRGRTVRLGTMLNTILNRHDYPAPVSALLGELVVLTVLLGSLVKLDGKFILQTQSDGPVSLAVVDFSTPDAVRAYARFDAAAVEKAIAKNQTSSRALLGEGALAMTIDQGEHMQRYQGIVALDGLSLEEAAHQYFRQSEQIPSVVRLAVAQVLTPCDKAAGSVRSWRAGGILTQFLPDSSARIAPVDLPGGDIPDDAEAVEVPREDDAWHEARALVGSLGDDELTDPQISAERLLFRLFNQHEVRVYDGIKVLDRCTCSRDKVISLVRGFGKTDAKTDAKNEDVITVCEFCNTVYTLKPEEIS